MVSLVSDPFEASFISNKDSVNIELSDLLNENIEIRLEEYKKKERGHRTYTARNEDLGNSSTLCGVHSGAGGPGPGGGEIRGWIRG